MLQKSEFKMKNSKNIKCPECGADINIEEEDSKSFICPFCGVSIKTDTVQKPSMVKFTPKVRRGCKGCN